MKIIKCDKCGNTTENPEKDGYCKVLVTKGMKWIHLGKGNHYTHYHFCKKCKEEVFRKS